MSERDPFEQLRDLIDESVAPRAQFASDLRSRLMREMSASDASREEQYTAMDAPLAPRPPLAFPIQTPRRIRPMVILELAAVAVIILGLVAALNRGWFQNDPDPATAVPAAILQDNTSTPETEPEQTSTPLPTVVPPTQALEGAVERTSTPLPMGTMEPTVVPPGNIPNTIWALPLADGESMDFGGMVVEDDTVYRLLATSSFVGVQAVDARTGTVKWQQAHRWAGNLFTIEDDVLYFDGGDTTLVAVDAKTGAERWRAVVEGNPIAIDEDDSDGTDRVFVLLDTDFVTALGEQTGEQVWVAQGPVPQDPSGGSVSIPATGKIAVENDVVAAVSTLGVLAGFDAATGETRWSHEGYDAAMVTILSEDDIFVVSEGKGGFGAGIGVSTGGSPAPGGVESGTVEIGAAPGSAAGDPCAPHFAFGTGVAPAVDASGTPEAGVQAAVDSSFRVQGIDPVTGDVLWEQQAATAGASAAGQDGPMVGGQVVVCTVDLQQGTVSGSAVAGSAASGVIDFDDNDGQIAIGVVTGGGFAPIQPAPGGDDDAVILLAPGVSNAEVIAIATNDDGTFVQLTDGTLVKVQTGGPADDDDHHEDRDDDDGSPESESEDD